MRAARNDARLTRLQSSLKRLPLDDALDVWDEAGIHEPESLNNVIFPEMARLRQFTAETTDRVPRTGREIGLREVAATFATGWHRVHKANKG